jgi:hypothetical protein
MSGPTEQDTAASGGAAADGGIDIGKRDHITTMQVTPAQPQSHPAVEAALTRSPADVYEERLRAIWQATHGGDSPPGPDSGDTAAWDLVREAVGGVENLTLIGAAVAEQYRRLSAGQAGGTQGIGLAGDPSTIELLVSTAIEQLPREEIPAFVSGPLAVTVERLQREVGRNGDMTRERIVDIVLRALEPLRGTAWAARLVPPLLGFLNGERRKPTIGIYATVAMLAQLTVGLNDRQSRLIRIFLYHYALVGVWRLFEQGDITFEPQVRQVVSVSAGNAGMNLWQLLPERTADGRGAREVLLLRTILTTTAREMGIGEAQAATILAALGLANPEARAALTVLNEAGALGGPWTSDWLDLAWLESAAAVAAIASGSAPDQAAARLYNAAVSLQAVAEPQAAGPLRARMLLDGLGLRWSLLLGTDVVDALDRLEGLDCASGFLRAVSQYQDEGHDQTEFWPPVIKLAVLLSDLPKRLPRNRPALAAGIAKLAEAARNVRLAGTVARDVGIEELAATTVGAIDALRPSGVSPQADDLQPYLLDTAALIRSVFEEILGRATWGLRDTIDEMVGLRSNPPEQFISRYQPFTEPPASRLGTGPPVTAGVVSPQEWEDIESALLHDPGSIVPALRQEFARQL